MGHYLDKKLTFRKHIEKLKAKCQKVINWLRSLCGEEWGADQDTLMNIYRALVRLRLDYGAILYNSAPSQVLNQLQPVVNECLRIATGAFKTSPVTSLQVIAQEKSLELRREELTLKYYFKMRSHIKNPAHPFAVTAKQELLFQNKWLPAPFAVRAKT